MQETISTVKSSNNDNSEVVPNENLMPLVDEDDNDCSIILNNAHNPLPNDENMECINIKENKKKPSRIIESDSEDEDRLNHRNHNTNKHNDEYTKILAKPQRLAVINSDSEDECQNLSLQINNSKEEKEEEKYKRTIETNNDQKDEESSDEKYKARFATLCDPDTSSDEEHSDNENHNQVLNKSSENQEINIDDNNALKSRLNALCDPESSDDEKVDDFSDEDKKVTPLQYRKKSKTSIKSNAPKPMTAKEAQEQRLLIQSDSQKRMREAKVSLPYHKPKSYTIKEFLARRPRLASVTSIDSSTSVPPSIAVKMTTQQLEIISKKMEEREKEIQKFYKSESESEPETDKNSNEETKNVDSSNIRSTTPTITNQLTENIRNEENMDSERSIPSVVQEKVDLNIQSELKEAKDVSIEIDSTLSNENVFEVLNTSLISKNNENKDVIVKDTQTIEKNIDVNVLTENTDNTTEKANSNDKKGVEDEDFEYDFNLDDEENTEPVAKNDKDDHINQLINRYNFNDTESSPKKNEYMDLTILNKYNPKLAKEVVNFKPTLSKGGESNFIDLSDDKEPDEISKLMERFIKHSSAKKTHPKNNIELSIINTDGEEFHKEKLSLTLHPEDEVIEVVEQKPGAGLKKLKDELQLQMQKKRTEFWKQRAQRTQKTDSDSKNVKPDYEDTATDILDDEEEEFELSASSASENEDDLQEDDVLLEDKPKTKSAFVEDEASESDIENQSDVDSANGEEEHDKIMGNEIDDDDEDEVDSNQGSQESDVNVDNLSISNNKMAFKKPLRRIITAFEDDSDEEENENSNDVQTCIQKMNNFMCPTTPVKNAKENMPEDLYNSESDDCFMAQNEDKSNKKNANLDKEDNKQNTSLDSTDPWDDDDYITPHQLRTDRTPSRTLTQSKSDIFGLFTPNLRLTALQDFTMPKESPTIDTPFPLPPEPSPLRDKNWSVSLQKNLFSDYETSETQTNMSELADMCSGNFTSSNAESQRSQSENMFKTQECTQDLLGLCSGKFTGLSQINSNIVEEGIEKKTVTQFEEDPILSELLKEDEMERFKKKLDADFESASLVKSNEEELITQKNQLHSNIKLDSSDEEDDIDKISKNTINAKKRKLMQFSDDENNSEDEKFFEDDENIEEDIDTDVENKNIDYDSEENEVIYDNENEEDEGTVVKTATDFFEDEAELSESEWGSADEDENGLDDFDNDFADEEEFDQKKLKNDLERIHMRRVLDDDNREVKILQEMYLEDGELHGKGRQRQFRWKNINNIDNDEIGPRQDDDIVYLEEDESEEQWRKMRHEREMFLKNSQSKAPAEEDIEDDFTDKLCTEQKVYIEPASVKNKNSTAIRNDTVNKINETEDDIKLPFMLMNKRGSFLARNDNVLTRLAEYTKVSTTVVGGPKNSRGFLFQSVEVKSSELISIGEKKRKMPSGTPQVLKKLRLSENLSPAMAKKLPKKGNNKVKKLFD